MFTQLNTVALITVAWKFMHPMQPLLDTQNDVYPLTSKSIVTLIKYGDYTRYGVLSSKYGVYHKAATLHIVQQWPSYNIVIWIPLQLSNLTNKWNKFCKNLIHNFIYYITFIIAYSCFVSWVAKFSRIGSLGHPASWGHPRVVLGILGYSMFKDWGLQATWYPGKLRVSKAKGFKDRVSRLTSHLELS